MVTLTIAPEGKPFGTFACGNCSHDLAEMHLRDGWSVLKHENFTITATYIECPNCGNEQAFLAQRHIEQYLM